jgi:hypothetical protein
MHFLQAINSDISVLIVCNKTGGTIKGDIKKKLLFTHHSHFRGIYLRHSMFVEWTGTINSTVVSMYSH